MSKTEDSPSEILKFADVCLTKLLKSRAKISPLQRKRLMLARNVARIKTVKEFDKWSKKLSELEKG